VVYTGNTEEIQSLKAVVREAVKESVREAVPYGLTPEVTGANPFPLYTVKTVSRLFGVSDYTVRAWVRQGELHPRYQVLSGRCYRLIFTTPDLLDFFDRNFPAPEDISDHPCNPRRGPKAARLIEKLIRLNHLYARRRPPRE